MMFCGKCGFNNSDTETVCQGCGAPLEAATVQPMAPPPAAHYAPPYAPQPGYPQQAPYSYPQQPYQAEKPRKPFFDGPFNSAGWWESAARLVAYIVGAWNIIASLITVAANSSYYSYSTWYLISNIFSSVFGSALTIAVVTLITFATKSLRENAANSATLVELKKEEAVKCANSAIQK